MARDMNYKGLKAVAKESQKIVQRSWDTWVTVVEYAWQEINRKDANNAILEHYSKDIHDYAVILNELANVKRELHKILEGE